MKKLLALLVIVFFSQLNASTHPLHLSVINISIEGKEMYVTINTFVDDWETAYFHYNSKVIDLALHENYTGEWFQTALAEAFQIKIEKDEKAVKMKLVKVTFEDLSMTIEMSAKLKNAPKSLYIYNAILTDIFPDQSNLVIISLDNKETGTKFDYKTKQKELKLR